MELIENQKKIYIKTDDNKFFNLITNEWEEVFLRKSNSYPIKEEINQWLVKEYDSKQLNWGYKDIPHKKGE